ncbi:MAG: aminotransferase class V-fold PLP-dependent enzyme [Gaiellales bacterium]|nr:aminotransferase class V-fold PLP-dependent enzyme [Gaiellales bacterium]
MSISIPSEEPPFDLNGWRSRIPLCRKLVMMHNCSQTPQCDYTRMAAERYLESWNTAGMDWDAWTDEVAAARHEFARLINADPDEVAVSTSVSEATGSLVSGLPQDGRRKIVTTGAEFPGVAHTLVAHTRYGLELSWVPLQPDGTIRLEDYDDVIDDDTLLVSATHAFYQSGYVQDIAAIAAKAHAHGAMVYVDAYQTAGVVPIDVKAMGIDFLATGNLKWLFGIPGVAFIYVKRDLTERLHPALTGWFGRTDAFAFNPRLLDWHPTAQRLETGTWPVAAAYVARAGLQIIRQVGVGNIRSWTQRLSAQLIEGGRARGLRLYGTDDVERKTPVCAFVCPGDSHRAETLMKKADVMVSARGSVIRLAPHFYNTPEEVEIALDRLADVYASPELAASTPRP